MFHPQDLGLALQSPGLGANCSQKSCYNASDFGPALVRGRNWNWIMAHIFHESCSQWVENTCMHKQWNKSMLTWGVTQQNWWLSAAWGYLRCGIRMTIKCGCTKTICRSHCSCTAGLSISTVLRCACVVAMKRCLVRWNRNSWGLMMIMTKMITRHVCWPHAYGPVILRGLNHLRRKNILTALRNRRFPELYTIN